MPPAPAHRYPARVAAAGPSHEQWFKQFPETIEGAGVDVRYDAVGYVELTHALQADLPVADVENVAGRFVSPAPGPLPPRPRTWPSPASATFSLSLLHTTDRGANPISSYIYLIVFARQDDPEKGRVLSSLLQYMAGPGQSAASRLNYTPVPRDLRESVAAKIRLLHDPDGHLLGP